MPNENNNYNNNNNNNYNNDNNNNKEFLKVNSYHVWNFSAEIWNMSKSNLNNFEIFQNTKAHMKYVWITMYTQVCVCI